MGRVTMARPTITVASGRVAAALPPVPKATDPHYHTGAHDRWVRAVRAAARGHCQAPGCTRHTGNSRMYADHIVEIRDGGSRTDPANGQLLCASHHVAKTHAEKRRRALTCADA